MKKVFILTLIVLSINKKGFSQTQLTYVEASAYKDICYSNELNDRALEILGKYYFPTEYEKARDAKDEFQLNKFNTNIRKEYELAKKNLNVGKIYYVTEEFQDYKYDFNRKGIAVEYKLGINEEKELDNYTEGALLSGYGESGTKWTKAWLPKLNIYNYESVPKFYEMPENIAELSFSKRKGSNRPPLKVRFYFKFLNCNEIKIENKYFNSSRFYDVVIVKVSLVDDLVNYKKDYNLPEVDFNPTVSDSQTDSKENQINIKNKETTIDPKEITKQQRKNQVESSLLLFQAPNVVGKNVVVKLNFKNICHDCNQNEVEGIKTSIQNSISNCKRVNVISKNNFIDDEKLELIGSLNVDLSQILKLNAKSLINENGNSAAAIMQYTYLDNNNTSIVSNNLEPKGGSTLLGVKQEDAWSLLLKDIDQKTKLLVNFVLPFSTDVLYISDSSRKGTAKELALRNMSFSGDSKWNYLIYEESQLEVIGSIINIKNGELGKVKTKKVNGETIYCEILEGEEGIKKAIQNNSKLKAINYSP